MSESPRKLIRKAVELLLVTPVGDPPAPPTLAGDRVYGNRATPVPPEKMPALTVYALPEVPATEWSKSYQLRSLQLLVQPHLDTKEEGGDELDDLTWAVERLLLDSDNLGIPEGGPVEIKDIKWSGTTLNINTPEGVIPGVGSVEIEIQYVWVRPVEEMDLAPFERIHGDQLGRPPEEGGAAVEFHAELPQE